MSRMRSAVGSVYDLPVPAEGDAFDRGQIAAPPSGAQEFRSGKLALASADDVDPRKPGQDLVFDGFRPHTAQDDVRSGCRAFSSQAARIVNGRRFAMHDRPITGAGSSRKFEKRRHVEGIFRVAHLVVAEIH